ncbi:MAG: ABC transporter substrate-binding protein [Desulfobulbaceae bacterium]|nr:ABC transporter substrate-binding protein [Desulfobulbaceae bacterium]
MYLKKKILTATIIILTSLIGAGVALAEKAVKTNLPSDPSQLDPITISELYSGDVLDNVYEGFTGIDNKGMIVPALAERWESSDGGKIMTFYLRKGVKFHTGRDFTAKDVKYTFEQLLIPENKGGLAAPYLHAVVGAEDILAGKSKELKGVKIIDDHRVEVHFSTPSVSFPIFPFRFMDSQVVAENGKDWVKEVSAGTGPFKLVHFKRGQEVRLEANKEYWGTGPFVDAVIFKIVSELDTALSMFETGELNLVTADRGSVRRLLKDSRFKDKLLTSPAAQVQYLAMNQNRYEPFKDIRVREAISIAYDRAAVIKGLFAGAAYPLYGFVTPDFPGSNPDLKPIKYDLERARKLLAEAGYPGGKGLPALKISATPSRKQELAYLADHYKKVLGLPIEVQVLERGNFIKAMNVGEIALFPWGWTADYADAATFLDDMYYSKSPYNRAKWVNSEFDALIEKARVTGVASERYKLYNQAEQIMLKDWAVVPTTMRKQVAVKSPELKGVYLTSFRIRPFNTAKID